MRMAGSLDYFPDFAGVRDVLDRRQTVNAPALVFQPGFEFGDGGAVILRDHATITQRIHAGYGAFRINAPLSRVFVFLGELCQIVPARCFSYSNPTCNAVSSLA